MPGKAELLRFDYVRCLRSFLALGDFELDLVTLLKTLVSLRTNRTIVNEYVRPIRATDEPISFRVVEPFHCAFQTFHEPLFLHVRFRGSGRARSQ